MTDPSELLDLWAQSDGAPWHAAVNRLRSTLTPPPPGVQPRLT